MIKVVFTYKIKTEFIGELMKKFEQSANPKFNSTPSNIGISIFSREDGPDTYVVLDIYYHSIEDYKIRTAFERAQDEWNKIWFDPNNLHEEVSVEVFQVLKK